MVDYLKPKEEIWKDISGYEGLYQASTYGRIKRLDGIVSCHKIHTKFWPGRILKMINKTTGYQQVTLSNNKISKIYLVHRIIAKTFLPNPGDKPQINHKDGDGKNNVPSNIEWCTPSENGLHAYRVLGIKAWFIGKTGKLHPTSKPVLQKTLDGKLIKKWDCGLDAVRESGFDSSCISRTCSGKSLTHKGYKWEYE